MDERTNTLVVTDTAEHLAWVRRTLATLDKPLRQVQIEARIAIVSSNLSEQLGFRWQLGGTQTRHDGTVIEASAVAGRAASGVGVALVDLGYARPTSWLDSQLSALASKGQAQVLAKPAIMTLDNASALIESGVEIPYQEVSTSGATSTSFKEASLSLEVAPQITPDNRVIMQLRVKQDTVGQIFNG
ncbi:MAG: type IV pilus secretin PilQ, partial [Pseudomonadota bacterium]|nr:type IV pilus secretin PilQ [Pseudomonadota bacterium]